MTTTPFVRSVAPFFVSFAFSGGELFSNDVFWSAVVDSFDDGSDDYGWLLSRLAEVGY